MKNYIKKFGIISALLVVLSIFTAQQLNAAVHFIEKNDVNSGTQLGRCSDRGYTKTSCPNDYKPNGYCPQNNKYFLSCNCDTTKFPIKVSDCKSPMVIGGNKACNNEYAEKCECPTDYKFTEAQCKSQGKIPDGDKCGNKYKNCKCDPNIYNKKCDAPLQTGINKCSDNRGDRYKDCGCSGQECNFGGAAGAQKCEFTGKTYWSSCNPETCKNKNSSYITESEIPNGQKCDYRDTVNGTKCYNNCGEICAKSDMSPTKISGKNCTTQTVDSKTCYKCNDYSKCEEINSTYLSNIPKGKICTEIQSNGFTCQTDCKEICSINNLSETKITGKKCTEQTISGKTCYKCIDEDISCQKWVKDNHPDKYNDTLFEDATLGYGAKKYGPKYFSYSECQKLDPLLTINMDYFPGHMSSDLYNIRIKINGELDQRNGMCENEYRRCENDYMYSGYKSMQDCLEDNSTITSLPNYYNCFHASSSEDCCGRLNVAYIYSMTLTLNDSEITLPDGHLRQGGLMDVRNNGKIILKGKSKINGQALAYETGARDGSKVRLVVERGADAYIEKLAPYKVRVEVLSGAKLTIGTWGGYDSVSGAQVNSTNTSLHVYGTVHVKNAAWTNAPITVYNGGAFSADKWNASTHSGGTYYGSVIYKTGARTQLGGICKKATGNGRYDIKKVYTSLPSNFPGSSCSRF